MAVKTANRNEGKSLNATLVDVATKGAIAGVIGGAVFGVQMNTTNMLPMVADMIGSTSIVVGFVLHMLISATIGGTYGIVAARIPANLPRWPTALAAGTVWGIIWWVLGALILMPVILGMSEMVLEIGDMQWMSFVGHIIFGIVMASFFILIEERS